MILENTTDKVVKLRAVGFPTLTLSPGDNNLDSDQLKPYATSRAGAECFACGLIVVKSSQPAKKKAAKKKKTTKKKAK